MNKDLCLHAIVMREKPRHVRGAKNKVFASLLKRDFRAEAKNKTWRADFAYIRLANGKMRYNRSVLGLYGQSIAASVNGTYINTELAKQALEDYKGTV